MTKNLRRVRKIMAKRKATRRSFVKAAGRGGSGLLMAPALLNAQGANERVVVGVVGCGERGSLLIEELQNQGCAVGALCDVAEMRIRRTATFVKGKPGEYEDFEKVLDRKDVDGVVNATPNHWHRDVLVAAVKAGKDVYTETPLAHTIGECEDIVQQVTRTKCVVQAGHCSRSGSHWHRARHAVVSGSLGNVTWCRMLHTGSWVNQTPRTARPVEGRLNWKKFLGKAPERPFDPHRYWKWRWFWDYSGGLMTDAGTHQLEVLHWLTDTRGPGNVAANGDVYYFKNWETPDVFHAAFNYDRFSGLFSANLANRYEGVATRFYGTNRTLVATGNRFYLIEESGRGGRPSHVASESWQRAPEFQAHIANWLGCIRSRRPPNCTVVSARQAANAAHVANIAFRKGRAVGWDPQEQKLVEKKD